MNNIIIICDDKKMTNTLKQNLMLLRKFDVIISCNFLNAEEIILQNSPAIILLYSTTTDNNILELIKKYQKIPILFISDDFSEETLLNLYDAGISDYILTSQSQSEFLIKAMFCIRKSIETKKLEKYSDILERIGIINKTNGLFSKKYTPAVFKNITEKYVKENIQLTLMAIAPDINEKNKCNFEYLSNLLKQNLRDEDLIGFGDEKLYILLPKTTHQGALEVYNKLKKELETSYSISAGILEINDKTDFKIIMQKTDAALEDALSLKSCAVVQEDLTIEPPMNWLDKKNKQHKNFKLFKKVFLKKLNTIITPIFYQKQQLAEQRLFGTKVEQFCDEKQSIFSLKKENYHSYIEITYPGTVKININIYKNVQENPEPQRQNYDLNQINEIFLSDMIDKFIRDFQKNN